MKGFKLLMLTDHKNHTSENSLYPLALAMRKDPRCASVEVASRTQPENAPFFNGENSRTIYVTKVTDDFAFSENGAAFDNAKMVDIKSFDAIWLRMPPPLTLSFAQFLHRECADQIIINDPKGIYQTGSKEFLVNFPDVCPPMRLCHSIEDIIEFKNKFPIVLKPFRDYGGKGIVRIEGEKVWEAHQIMTFTKFAERLKNKKIEYLGVKFLKNVGQGDKRIIVVRGTILGAALRLPAKGSWLCNVAMGGSAQDTEVNPEEVDIVARINPTLSKMGIVKYGVDTLVGDDGKRVLSEINTTSIGGLPQIAEARNEPLVEKAVGLIWDYITSMTQKII